jgi:hypothetical protein
MDWVITTPIMLITLMCYIIFLRTTNTNNKNIEILPVNLGKDKCLLSGTNTGTIKEQLIELKTYYYDNKR